MKIRHVAGVVAAGMALSLSSATAATAWSHSSTIAGSWAFSDGWHAYNRDTAADGDWTRTNYQTSIGGGTINNTSGYKAEIKKYVYAKVTAVQACRSRNALPMVCAGWNGDY